MKKDLSELLRESDCVPEAPDCRSAVMERISAPARGRPVAWAYVFATVVVAIVGTWVLMPHVQRQSSVVKVVKTIPPSPRQIVHHVVKPAIEKPQAVIEKRVATAPRPRRVHVALTPKQVSKPNEVIVMPQPQPTVVQTPAPPITSANRPVAIAIVTWPSQRDQSSDTYSYGYVKRDTATGQTTECRVKRSGDSVEIYMESKPEAEEPPVKGSLEHAAKPNA